MIEKKENLLVECSCHGYHYLEFNSWDDLNGEVIFALVDEPSGFWKTIWMAWRHRNRFVSEVILTQEQLKKVIEYLNQFKKEQ